MIVLRYESLDNSCFQKTRRTGGGGGGSLLDGGIKFNMPLIKF